MVCVEKVAVKKCVERRTAEGDGGGRTPLAARAEVFFLKPGEERRVEEDDGERGRVWTCWLKDGGG